MRNWILRATVATLMVIPGKGFAQTYCGGGGPNDGQGYYCGPVQGYASADPTAGSPNSMPIQNAQVALDLFDVQPEGDDVFTPEGDSDTVGGAVTAAKAGLQKSERYDLHYQHARRFAEGSRARWLLDVPINVLHANQFELTQTFAGTTYDLGPFGGATAVYGTINTGVEFPIAPNWLVTPRVNYTNMHADSYFGKGGEQLGGSVTTRYRLPQIGRGDLVFGGMVAYAHSIKTFLTDQPFYQPLDLWTVRAGLAYQLPLKRRMFGRQSSIRASYVFTNMSGFTQMPYRQLHEVGVSIGVRTREAEQKNRFEQLRIGLLYTRSNNTSTSTAAYNAATLTLGYRF